MFKRVVLEKRHNRLGKEEQLLARQAEVRGIPVVTTYEKTVARGHFIFEPTDLVAGSVGFMHHAMRSFGIHVEHNHPYPEAIKHLMHRKVLPIYTRRDLRRHFATGGNPVFVKPVETKIFTGFVCSDPEDPRFNGVGNQKELICTEVVEFVHEWRVYVANGRAVSTQCATPSDQRPWFPNPVHVREMIEQLNASMVEPPAGYTLDIGVLTNGKLALVEVNDGYSIGAYGKMLPSDYWDVIASRWAQLQQEQKA